MPICDRYCARPWDHSKGQGRPEILTLMDSLVGGYNKQINSMSDGAKCYGENKAGKRVRVLGTFSLRR